MSSTEVCEPTHRLARLRFRLQSPKMDIYMKI